MIDTSAEEYNLHDDWKFMYIVYFANNFKNTLALEQVTCNDLEVNLSNLE